MNLNIELNKFNLMIKNKINFSLIRFGDLEIKVLNNEAVTYSGGRWTFDPEIDKNFRNELMNSFLMNSDNFYIGLICPNCYDTVNIIDTLKKYRKETKNKNFTFTKIWQDSNYLNFITNTLPLFKQYDVYLICHYKADINFLPFKVTKSFRINTNPWIRNTNILEEIKKTIDNEKIQNQLFLFCAGPYSNILIHKLYCINPNNLYLDIGSPLDPFFYQKNTRKYLIYPQKYKNIDCEWNNEFNNY